MIVRIKKGFEVLVDLAAFLSRSQSIGATYDLVSSHLPNCLPPSPYVCEPSEWPGRSFASVATNWLLQVWPKNTKRTWSESDT